MGYPNSITNRVQTIPRRSGDGGRRATGPFPRRTPGRPVPQRPRRPALPTPRPATRPLTMPVRGPVSAVPAPLTQVGRPASPLVRFMGKLLPLVALAGAGVVLYHELRPWGGAKLFKVPTGWTYRSYGALSYGGGLPAELALDAITSGGSIAPGLGRTRWASTTYDPSNYQGGPQPAYLAAINGQAVSGGGTSLYRAIWIQTNSGTGAAARYAHVATYWRLDGYPSGTPFPIAAVGGLSPLPMPAHDGNFWRNMWPMANPVAGFAPAPAPKPIRHPVHMPEPTTPEQPDVGPRPLPRPRPEPSPWPGQPAPQPQPGVEPIPLPPELPGHVPYINWPQAVPPVGRVVLRGPRANPRSYPRANPRAVRAQPRTKEVKARAGRVLGFIWGSFGHITETVDVIDVAYEALPKNLKRQLYSERGRQPNPQERLELLYRHIGQFDVERFVTGYIKMQIEDAAYALGGRELAEQSRIFNRPVGYQAGGSLTGGGPSLDGAYVRPPQWWPEWLPWNP